jgi:hypothetical protein
MRRTSLIALAALLLSAPVLAQGAPDAGNLLPRKPTAKKASAASSLGIDKEDDAVAAKPVRKSPAAGKASETAAASSEADTALVRAMLFAYEPAPQEIRVIAVEDLALLGDGRALNALAQLIFDVNPAVQSAAVRAVAQYQAPRAEEILCNVVRHPLLPEKIKLQAIEALVFQRSPTSREFLSRLTNTATFSYNLQNAARKALVDWGGEPPRF